MTAAQPLLSQTFDRGQISDTRRRVAARVATTGLCGPALEDFVLAINEIITNAVVHGGGQGRLRLWLTTGLVHCEVRDFGRGARPDRFNGLHLPPTFSSGGRGMYLVRQLCESVDVHTSPTGTTVSVSYRLTD